MSAGKHESDYSGTSDKGHSEIWTTSNNGHTKFHQLDIFYVNCMISDMRTTGTTELSQCVHYSEVPLYQVPDQTKNHNIFEV